MNAEWFRFPDKWTETLADLDDEVANQMLFDRAFHGTTIPSKQEEEMTTPFDAPAVTPQPARTAGPIARAVAYLIVTAITASLVAVLVGVAVRLWEWAL